MTRPAVFIDRIEIIERNSTMIIISSRKSFDDADSFADQDEIADVTIGPGGSIADRQGMQPSRLTEAVAGKSVLVLIHGYNNELGDALRAYNHIERQVSNLLAPIAYDMVVGYVWPGGDRKLEYHPARRRASAAGERFVSWLPVFAGATSVDVMTHSMGTRVFLRGMSPGVPANSAPVRYHLATASAVDNESIEFGEPFYPGTQSTAGTWVFHSKRDGTLRYAYKIGDYDIALGLTGPEDPAKISRHSKNVKVVNCRAYVGSHGDYKKCDEFYAFLKKIVADEHPLSRQFYTL